MKKLILAIAFALFLTSCRSGEVQSRVVVHAIGIDRSDNGYEVSYQVFSGGDSSDSGPVDASEETVKTLLSSGVTLSEAEKNLSFQTGKDIFLGDVELLLISDELKEEDISSFLQYFRNSDIYLGVNVCYCRGKAKETVGAKLEQGAATSILLRSVIQRAVSHSAAMSSRIIEISNTLADGEAIAIPVLTLEQGDDSDEGSTISDNVIGVFESVMLSQKGFLGETDSEELSGTRLLKGDAEKLELEANTPEGKISLKIDKIKIKRKLEIKDSLPLLKIDISGEYNMIIAPPDMPETEVLAAAETRISELCSKAAEKMSETGADLINLKKMLEKYQPEYARRASAEQAIGIVSYEVTVKLKKY